MNREKLSNIRISVKQSEKNEAFESRVAVALSVSNKDWHCLYQLRIEKNSRQIVRDDSERRALFTIVPVCFSNSQAVMADLGTTSNLTVIAA